MRVRSRRLAVVAVALSALFPAAALAQGPCADGEALLAAGLLDQARAWLSATETADPCRDDLADALAQQRGEAVALLERGMDALQAENTVEGRELLAQALGLDQSLSGARDALESSLNTAPTPTPSTSPRPYAGAEALSEAGFAPQARDALVEDAKAHGEPVPSGLRYLTDTPWPVNFLQPKLLAGIFPLIAWITPLVLAAIAIIFIITLRVTQPSRFLVEDLQGSSDAEDVGKQAASMIEEALQQAKREGGGGSLSIITQPDPVIQLPAEVEQLPYGKFLAPILNLAVPPKITKLQGRLHVLDGQLVGATSSLVSPDNTVSDTTTVWLNDFATPLVPLAAKDEAAAAPDQVQLGVHTISAAVSAWARFALPDAKGSDVSKDKRRNIPTSDWRSLAFMQVGALHHLAGKKHRLSARRLYVKSLDHDPRNSGTLFNLAMLDMGDERWTVGRERFEQARRRIEAQNWEAGISDSMDRLWYRCVYNLGAAHFHEWIASGASKTKIAPLNSAGRIASVVALNALRSRELSADQSLRSFLTMAGQSALVMLAGSKIHLADAGPEGSSIPTQRNLLEALGDNSLRRLSAAEIVEFVVGPEAQNHGLSYRVHYNLACYYTMAGNLDEAIKEFDLGLEGGDMVRWAPSDPTLEALRKRRSKDWNDALARHSDPSPEPPKAPWWQIWKWQLWG